MEDTFFFNTSFKHTQTTTTKNLKRKQLVGPPRGGMKDGPNRTDNSVTTAMDTDNDIGSRTPGNEKILRNCKAKGRK